MRRNRGIGDKEEMWWRENQNKYHERESEMNGIKAREISRERQYKCNIEEYQMNIIEKDWLCNEQRTIEEELSVSIFHSRQTQKLHPGLKSN